MTPSHFHAVILGDSLAARIAGTLLARAGRSVLHFRHPAEPTPPAWYFSCLLLERLLESLEGRNCFLPAGPIQVLTPDARVTIHGGTPLVDELRRELGRRAQAVDDHLRRLRRRGDRLAEVVWDVGLPLFGVGSRWQYLLGRWRRRLVFSGGRSGRRPVPPAPDRTPDALFLQTLLCGLSGCNPEQLTSTEAALLWAAASRSEALLPEQLHEFLGKRFEQYHGRCEDFSRVKSIETNGTLIRAAALADGGYCTADHFLLGSRRAVALIPFLQTGEPASCPGQRPGFALQINHGQLSDLVAAQVLLAAEPAWRLSLDRSGRHFSGLLELPENDRTVPETELRQRLETVLPFVDYDLSPLPLRTAVLQNHPEACPEQLWPGVAAPLKLSTNLMLTHGPSVLPRLGSFSDAAVGISAARHLLGPRFAVGTTAAGKPQ